MNEDNFLAQLVVYREFDDGEDEIGILTFERMGQVWVHVGDFDYYLNWNSFGTPFTIIGFL